MTDTSVTTATTTTEAVKPAAMPRVRRPRPAVMSVTPLAAEKVKDSDIHVLMDLAMCASYDPDPESYMGIRLPVTQDTCEIIPERWANFEKWDPLTLVETHFEALKKLKVFYFDCGDVDQYNMVYGSRRLARRLTALDVPHIYEEFADDHSSTDYRMDRSLPLLAKALS